MPSFLIIFSKPFCPDLRPPACAATAMESLLSTLHTFFSFPHKHKINFSFTSICTTGYFIFFFLMKPLVCHAQLFHHTNTAIFTPFLLPILFFMHIFEILNTFSQMLIEILRRKDDFTKTSQVPFTFYFIEKTNFLCIWSSPLWS